MTASDEPKRCERCYANRAVTTEKSHRDPVTGEWQEMEVCSACQHDLINAGDPHADAYDVLLERHRSDPLWEPHPDDVFGAENEGGD